VRHNTSGRGKSKYLKISPRHGDKILSQDILQTAYHLWYLETAEARQDFIRTHRTQNRKYEKELKEIGKIVSLPVKECVRCGILFLPDYRAYKQQKNCPYGCVDCNYRENKKKPKKKYRKTENGREKAREHNRSYRQRKKNREVEGTPVVKSVRKRDIRKLRRQLVYFYHRLNPGATKKKLRQFERILKKIEKKARNVREAEWTSGKNPVKWKTEYDGKPP